MEPSSSSPASVKAARERTVRALCAHFARDDLGTEEFESRLERAYKATSPAELAGLTADLPALADVAAESRSVAPTGPPVAVAAPSEVRERQVIAALMGGTTRRGPWTPARQIFVAAVMGGVDLDLREARFAPGITEIVVFGLMGGVDIIVPPGLPVECGGVAIMGGFDHFGHSAAATAPDAPRLRIQGLALMGGVDVQVRLPGESKREARRRLREERKRLKQARKAQERG